MKGRLGIFKLLFFFFIAAFVNQKVAAQNLVPNPNFEDTLNCPNFVGGTLINAAENWHVGRNSPDYFNSCVDDTVSLFDLPTNGFGFQQSISGFGYGGFFTYGNPSGGSENYREFIYSELSVPLTVGNIYYLSFYVAKAAGGYFQVHWSTNKIGSLLTTYPYISLNTDTLPNFAHVVTSSIITDTLNWTLISGSFLADSAYNYISFGNFFNTNLTQAVSSGPPSLGAYYYIDDICLSLDSTYCDNWTSTPSIASIPDSKPKIICTFDQITISSTLNIKACTFYNSLGLVVYDRKGIKEKQATISTDGFSTGIYFVQVKLEDERVYNLKVFRQ